MKDKLYNYFVRKNERVWYEYERYVREHMVEHRVHRLRHIWLLIKLNWFYRVKKMKTPYIYEDASFEKSHIGMNNNSLCTEEHTKKECLEVLASEENYTSEYIECQRKSAYAFAYGLKDYDVISFDIFDTLIIRKVNLPEHLFVILGKEFGIYDFRGWRIKAEKEVRDRNKALYGNSECNITEIYQRLNYWTGISVSEGVQREIQIELEMCEPNLYMLYVYHIMRSLGKRIYATSNMYLPKDVLSRILSECGYDYFEDVIVSCDYRLNKCTGRLFDVVKKRERRKKIIHVGDNRNADIKGAAKGNIDSRYYKACREIGDKYRPRGFSPLVGSVYYALVNNRLHNGQDIGDNYSPEWEFGYKYGGLAALGYVSWIHRKAKDKNKDLVVFLARDGAVLKKIYDHLFDDISSTYILWSRLSALRCMDVSGNKGVLLKRIFVENSNKGMSISDVMDYMGLNEMLDDMNKELFVEAELCDENISYVCDYLVNHWNIIEEIGGKYKREIKLYLKKLLGDSKRVCLVDLGWTGKNPMVLKQIMIEMGYSEENIDIYLLGSICKLQNSIDIYNESIQCYMFNFEYNREAHDLFCLEGASIIDVLEKMFSQSSSSFSGIDFSKEFLFQEPEIENYNVYSRISDGIIDFAYEYNSKFEKYEYLLNISGYDAYIPIRKMWRNKKELYSVFHDSTAQEGMSDKKIKLHNNI